MIRVCMDIVRSASFLIKVGFISKSLVFGRISRRAEFVFKRICSFIGGFTSEKLARRCETLSRFTGSATGCSGQFSHRSSFCASGQTAYQCPCAFANRRAHWNNRRRPAYFLHACYCNLPRRGIWIPRNRPGAASQTQRLCHSTRQTIHRSNRAIINPMLRRRIDVAHSRINRAAPPIRSLLPPMPRRVRIAQWIIEAIRIAIVTLWITEVGNDGVRLDEPAKFRVVIGGYHGGFEREKQQYCEDQVFDLSFHALLKLWYRVL